MKPHISVTLVLTTTLLLLNSAIAQEIINTSRLPAAPNGRRSAKRMGGTIRHPT